ncbi:MAG: dihydroxyacetone kinase subunit DhaK, partial [Oscillospiraceae bacterium]|nr:dihydroxyacetone kinase subunit DhaK [Oscillospiraceae bacterium]
MKMKKFMNAPETVTDEELTGLGLAYSDILDVDGHLVISKDLADADRVTIVTYGGSGHEPAQAGFVGKGGLDIQAVGDIFAAPNGQLVFDAMKLADKGHGVLLLTLNYAGDQLAGKQAMKLAKKAGMNVRQVVTCEEIQFDPNGEDNKRGLAGAVALYHVAAAAAREGKTLDEVAEIAQRYADNMASITI